MITDLDNIKNNKNTAKQLIEQIKYLAETKGLDETEKFEIKFRIEKINNYW